LHEAAQKTIESIAYLADLLIRRPSLGRLEGIKPRRLENFKQQLFKYMRQISKSAWPLPSSSDPGTATEPSAASHTGIVMSLVGLAGFSTGLYALIAVAVIMAGTVALIVLRKWRARRKDRDRFDPSGFYTEIYEDQALRAVWNAALGPFAEVSIAEIRNLLTEMTPEWAKIVAESPALLDRIIAIVQLRWKYYQKSEFAAEAVQLGRMAWVHGKDVRVLDTSPGAMTDFDIFRVFAFQRNFVGRLLSFLQTFSDEHQRSNAFDDLWQQKTDEIYLLIGSVKNMDERMNRLLRDRQKRSA